MEEALNRDKDVNEQLQLSLQLFDELEGVYVLLGSASYLIWQCCVPDKAQAEDKPKYFYLRGRALNVIAEHCPESEKYLSKAIKLNSNLLEAWNELGFCMWKKGDPLGAKKCFIKNVK